MDKRIFFAVIVISILSQTGYSYVVYDISVGGSDAVINSTLALESQRAVNYWDVRFQLPQGSQIISIHDSVAKIETYSFDGKNIAFRTNSGAARTKEVVTVTSVLPNAVNAQHSPLKIANFSLAGFTNESTVVTLSVPERLLTTNLPLGYVVEKQHQKVRMQGTGPVNIVASYSNEGTVYTNFYLYGSADLSDADRLAQVIPRILGIVPPYTRFPVVVMSDSEYEKNLDSFSAASFRPGGIIFVRQSKVSDPQFTSILLHETTHAYNDQILKWVDTGGTWFDEGTATYVGYVVNVLLNVRQSEIFGEEVRYTSGNKIYIYPTRGDTNDLWNYYQQSQTWMRAWTPAGSTTGAEREFGYTFSELLIRDYIIRNGDSSLHSVYRQLSTINREVSEDEATSIILQALGSDMKPCYSLNREEFDSCLKKVNSAKPSVPNVDLVQEKFGSVVDTESLVDKTLSDIEKERSEFSLSNIGFMIRNFIDSILRIFTKQ